MTNPHQPDEDKIETLRCACASLGLSNYANADVAAIFNAQDYVGGNLLSLRSRHARASKILDYLKEMEESPIVDLNIYRSLLKHFGALR